jgi:hypothetical protein
MGCYTFLKAHPCFLFLLHLISQVPKSPRKDESIFQLPGDIQRPQWLVFHGPQPPFLYFVVTQLSCSRYALGQSLQLINM